MALNKRHMVTILLRNGHLKVEGDESTEELRLALQYLRRHTVIQCRKPHLGVPIETLLPDSSVIGSTHTRSRNAQSVVDRKERV